MQAKRKGRAQGPAKFREETPKKTNDRTTSDPTVMINIRHPLRRVNKKIVTKAEGRFIANIGLSGAIRTRDPRYPKAVLSQAELRTVVGLAKK